MPKLQPSAHARGPRDAILRGRLEPARPNIAPMVDFEALRDAPKGRVPEVRNAYRFLRGAHSSVSRLFEVVQNMSQSRRTTNRDARGRMASEEVDVLRAAIVFTSSGLDASMKRLVNDAGRYLVPIAGTGARGEYEAFLRRKLSEPEQDKRLLTAVASIDPAGALMEYYLAERSRASFQGSGDLESRVRKCLGIAGSRVPTATLQNLDEFFVARNSIVHSMDYVDVGTSAKSRRFHRSSDETTALCNGTFAVAADLIHAVADVVIAHRPQR